MNLKKVLFSMLLLLATSGIPALCQNRSINFIDKPWDEILKMSKDSNKLIFMDAFATWCGPCKWMAANIFTNDTVADYYNRHFICVQVDMEKGEGLTLRKKYSVAAYPTLLFINSEGVALHRRTGATQKIQDYITLADNAMNPKEQLQTYLNAYNKQALPPEQMPVFLERLKDAYIPAGPVFAQYFAGLNDQQKVSRKTWEMIKKYDDDIFSPVTLYVIQHEKEYDKLVTPDSVFKMITQLFVDKQIKRLRNRTLPADSFAIMKADFAKAGYSQNDRLFFIADLTFDQYTGNNQAFMDLAMEGVEKYKITDPYLLNNIAVVFSRNTTDPAYIEKAISWSSSPSNLTIQRQ